MLDEILPDLVVHLLACGRLDDTVDLLCKSGWLAYRSEQYGLEQAHHDVQRTVRAAVLGNRDELVVPALAALEDLALRYRQAWGSRTILVDLACATEPGKVRGLVRASGESALPWSALLGAVRLMDLNLVSAAVELIEEVVEGGWPSYSANPSARGLLSWAEFGTDPLGQLLIRLVTALPSSTARLAVRLFEGLDSQAVPNRYTVWASLLRALVEKDGSIAEICAVADLTHAAILPGPVVLGLQSLFEAQLEALDKVADRADGRWLQHHWVKTLEILSYLETKDKEIPWVFRALAPLLSHLARTRDRSNDRSLRKALDDTLSDLRQQLPVPTVPERGNYHDRCLVFAKYAVALKDAGDQRYRQAAHAALASCALDAALNDPPRGSVSEALKLLSTFEDHDIADEGRSIRANIKWPLTNGGTCPSTRDLDVDSSDVLERGLALLRMSRGGYDLSVVPPARVKVAGHDVKDKPTSSGAADTASERALRALVWAWCEAGTADGLERAQAVDVKRSLDSRDDYAASLPGLRRVLARAFVRRGKTEEAVRVLTEGVTVSSSEGDATEALKQLLALARFNLEAVKRNFDQLPLRGIRQRRLAVSRILGALSQSGVVTDEALLRKWLDWQGTRRKSPELHEVLLLERAGGCDAIKEILQTTAVRILDYLADHMPEEAEDCEENSKASEKRLEYRARLLAAVGAIRGLGQEHQSRYAALLNQSRSQLAESGGLFSVLLKPITEGGYSIRNAMAAEFYSELARDLLPKPSEPVNESETVGIRI